mgnify:CR=1 FL=1
MSRRDSTSLKVRGVPRELLDALDRAAEQSGRSRNAVLLAIIGDYASGKVAPRAPAPPFDPARPANLPHPEGTAALAISGIAPDVWRAFTERGRIEGWHATSSGCSAPRCRRWPQSWPCWRAAERARCSFFSRF